MQNKLVVKNLSKSYDRKPVLRDINCSLYQGEVVGLFGPNGAGKTTLFSIIIGLVKADLGELSLNNQDITNLPMYSRSRLGLGYLPQESSIFRGLSVKDNIIAILEITLNNKQEIESKCEELMDEFSISHLKNKSSSTLSGGERRRLEIARTLAANPKFILLDEPLAGIDPIAVKDIKLLVSHLKNRNIGILITDHNVRDTLDIVDRAYIIYDGKVLMEGKPSEIVGSSEVREVYLGQTFLEREYN
ncbi:LptB superfamily ABC transporter ATP-binding protein [Candidatus Megaera venefica]|jgi:lipopolysaccharide export system ATP-binding protein|uniref:LptB superfamily ABC transporter ATP-binding protein n=1 Tax=Candidatus Megaera venefica TaxID=2055910 RepID=A0ABU5NBU6_9RICK|nr:LPS export ABC transporter ATP-binding protein [Candidatus Megaera venefica]MBY0534173.1 LPS export ABC transporter ATP-binding protein [Rickettsiaceae bacterium]MEA0970648.1 LptB superfamily ABC transporter ATP-binding protein [Candidatus Megaera venefica]